MVFFTLNREIIKMLVIKNSGLQRGKFDKLEENSLLNIYLASGGIRQEELSEVLRHCYRTATGKARPQTEGLKAKFML